MMGFNTSRKVYESLPLMVKQGLCLVPFSWWAGKAYRETFARGSWFDRASREELLHYQEQRLRKVLRFAVDQVPAYQHLRQIVERLEPFETLKAFPLVDKDTLQANLANYLSRDFNRMPHYEVTTGGTGGNQLRFFVDDSSQAVETAFVHRCWARVGYTPRCKKATFRGVGFSKSANGLFWQHNPVYNELQFSPFHMSETNLASYVQHLAKYCPQYLHGYPSAIDIFAEYVLRHGLQDALPQIKAAFLVSEGVTTDQRDRIEAAFRTRVFSFYGHSERVIFGGECERNSTYHQFPDYGYLEVIGENGLPCRSEGDRGELVGTGFLCRCMPLIRYRTGDYATLLEPDCECDRKWDRFTDIEGRWKQDMLVGRTGARISLAALNMHGPMFANVRRYQYYQDTAGECIIKMMVTDYFTENQSTCIRRAYEDKAGSEINFSVEIVDDMPLTERGKFKRLDARLSEQHTLCAGAFNGSMRQA